MTFKISLGLIVGLCLSACVADIEAAPQMQLSDQYIGSWEVARPDAPGVIVNVPMATCDTPIVITAEGAEDIVYASPKAEKPSHFELMAFNDRVTWIPMLADGTPVNSQYTYIAETVSDDEFLFYTVVMGKADWDDPKLYTRCK